MAKAAGSAGGSLLKLDAICAKLKNNLETQSDDVQDETPQPEPNNNTQLKPSLPDSPVQEHDDNSLVAIPVTMETDPVPVTMETDLSTSSRKSRRKSQRPRSIAHFTEIEPKVGLVEYELNNPEMDFDSICEAAMEEDEDEEEEHKAFIRYHSDDEVEDTDQRFQSSLSSPEDESKLLIDEDYEALDLTVAQPTPVSERAPAVWEDNVSEGVPEENGVLNLSITPKKDPPKRPKTGSDEVEMKDYAENTMNELLNMYGLGEDGEQHSISSSMSLKHFSSGSVLNHSPRQHPHAEKMISRRHLLSLADLPGQRSLPRSGGQVEVDMNEDSEDDSIHGAASNHGDKLGAAYIKAFGDNPLPGDQDVTMGPSGRLVLPDYYKYLKRFNSYEECRNHHCEEVGYKEHYHCIDCSFRVFLKKEEMVRHFKWHKKREESLQQGFMRYSPMDDCGKKYAVCPHNGKQTHYHCIQMGCSKVYISTSDVQMHANYHRKDSAILQEGFQRFRATEDCGTVTCTFHNQRTTHFHCRRPQCSFTFKNKADMEKHKTYHQKDEILARDGFKKFMKYEHCNYGNCRYSKASNHIHCIRPGCNYVLHSTGQLYSHKRKHERRDFENAYKNYRDNKSYRTGMKAPTLASFQGPVMNPGAMATGGIPAGQVLLNKVPGGVVGLPGFPDKEYDMDDLPNMRMSFPPPSALDQSSDESCDEDMMPQRPGPAMPIHADPEQKAMPSTLQKLATKINSGAGMGDSLNLMMPIKQESVDGSLPSPGGASLPSPGGPGLDLGAPSPQNPLSQMTFVPKVSPPVNEKKERDESWKKYLTRYTANDPCHSRCQFLYKDHYHCNSANCGMLFRSKDGVREHAKFHDQQDRITSLTFMTYEDEIPCPEKCPLSAKLHYHCLWADCKHVIAGTDPVFSRMEHYKIHEYSRAAAGRRLPVMPPRPMDTFKRRRGRPPKYPKNEIPLVPKVEMGEEEIAVQARHSAPQHCITSGFKRFSPADPCPDDKCMFFMKEHYHCLRPRCHHATDRFDVLNLHAKDFHSYITIREGFEFFDRTVNCRRPHCHNNRVNRHFHCVRSRCDYSFVRVGTMAQHDKKHKMVEMGLNPISFPVSTKVLLPPKSATLVTNPITIAPVNIAPAQNAGIIRAAGTFFPDQKQQKGPGLVQVTSKASIMMTMSQVPTVTSIANKPAPIILTPVNVSSAPQLITIAPKPAPKQNIIISQAPMISVPKPSTIVTASAEAGSSKKNIVPNGNNALPLTMLLQQKASNLMPQTSWVSLLLKMHYNAQQNCGRPFCKLKKKDHYHCFDCTQAFSDPARLKAHVSKHGFSVDKSDFLQGRVMPISEEKLAASVTTVSSNSPDSDEEEHSLNLHPGAFSNILEKGIDQSVTSASSAVHVMDLSKPQVKVEETQDIQKTNGAEESTVKSDDATEPENEADQSTQQQPDLLECLGLRKASDQTDTKSRRSSRKRVATKHGDFVNSDAALAKVRRTSASSGVHQSMTSARQTPTNSPKQATPPAILNVPNISKVNISIAAKPKTPSPKATNALPKKPAVVAKSPPDVVAPLVINPAQVEVYDDYRKFRFSEDCEFERCAYRQSQTHYHCTLPDCGYAFCDKGRFVQHSERHKRIAELMADEFQQYRANMDCKRPDCEIKTRSTHFHCLKCTFVCMDSSKVTAHRKHHTKMDNMAAQGFQKYSLGEVCPVEKCAHANKHTHYHCTRDDCAQVALGPAQMSAHKVMHDHKDNSK